MHPILATVAFYLRNSPIEKGRWRLLRWALANSRRAMSAHETRVLTTRCGFRMEVDLGDWLGRHIYISGEYEPATTVVIEKLVQPRGTMLDIGANAGYFTLLGAQLVGTSGRVIAFEPAPATRQALLRNVELNHFAHVEVRSEAAFNVAGESEFNEGPTDHSGIASLRSIDRTSKKIQVTTAPLDDLLPQGLPVSLVKIDVEGAEYQVLEGMRRTLERERPDLVVEVTDDFLRGMGRSAAELRDYLCNLGYRMYVIEHEGLLPTPPDSPAPTRQCNALFTQRVVLPDGLWVLPAEKV